MKRNLLIFLTLLSSYSCGYRIRPATTSEGKTVYVRSYSTGTKQKANENKYLFRKYYSKSKFDKFNSNITEGFTNDYIYFQYDTTRIYIDRYPVDGRQGIKYVALFRSGLLSPYIISCALNSSCTLPKDSIDKRYTYRDTITFSGLNLHDDKDFLRKKYDWTGAKVYFSNIEELSYLERKTTRIFKLEHKFYRGGPTNAYYFLELTNESADKNTPLEVFLRSAKVTFFKHVYTTGEIYF